jgi:diaminopimelate decarboxylase/aspartate kinase
MNETSWVVLKFGGSSVATAERWKQITSIVHDRAQNSRVLVVCSALSGISDMLESLPSATLGGQHEPILEAIKAQHNDLADSLGVDVAEHLDSLCENLNSLCLGASLVGEFGPRLSARVLSAGELLSTRIGAGFLHQLGIDCAFLDARTCLTSQGAAGDPWRHFLSATVDDGPDPALQDRLNESGHRVYLTQGFIARDPEGHTVLLGRGGSDVSAALFASALQAECCEIFSDVPGMYTANPMQVPTARLLKQLDYDEAQELASMGAKVLHPRALAPLRRAGIALHLGATHAPHVEGTRILPESSMRGRVKAVSAKRGITLVRMDTIGMWQQVGFLADAFACFKTHGLSIDLVSTSEANVTVSLDPTANAVDQGTLDALIRDLSAICKAAIVSPCATVSLVGRDIRTILHELSPVFAVFEERRVHLLSQAASDLNLSFVVDEHEADRLVAKLHALLFAGLDADDLLGPTWKEVFDARDTEEAQEVPWWVQKREALLALADRESSPRYVYDRETLAVQAEALKGLTAVDRIFYAMKANSHPEVLKAFEAKGLGFECVSPGEIAHVFSLFPELDPGRILFTPNFAPREEYADALAQGVHVTVDSLYPLESWPEIFRGHELLLRMDPGRGRGHHKHVRTAGSRSKFGIASGEMPRLTAAIEAAGATVVGLHAHSGSGIRTHEAWSETLEFLLELRQYFPALRYVDVGGGLGVPEKPGQAPLNLERVDKALGQLAHGMEGCELWLEPGRFLVAQAGVLLTRVTQLKQKANIHYVGVDAGMNSLIRPALYGAHHGIHNLSRLDEKANLLCQIVGPICETGDTLGHARRLPAPEEGDVILIENAGAYGRVMASFYNLRPPAEESLVD